MKKRSERRYVVGRNDEKDPGCPKFRRRWFATLREAEDHVAEVVWLKDKVGVVNGEYYIDGPCGRGAEGGK